MTNNNGRIVYIPFHNIQGEIVSEHLHGAEVRYVLGGFSVQEFLTADDYEILDYFDFEEDDE